MATKTKAQKQVENILADRAEIVGMDDIKPFHNNPRVGNLEAIRESLRENGQFRPLIVQRSTGEIIGGNHTWKAAKAEGWNKISVVYLDVDDDRATKIVLADNRTNDLATYDTDILADLLRGVPDVVGTGYDTAAVDALLESAAEHNREVAEQVIRPVITPAQFDQMTRESGNYTSEPSQGPASGEAVTDVEHPDGLPEAGPVTPKDMPDRFQEALDTIPGAFGLKIDAAYEMEGDFHFPPLRTDMLVQPEEVPTNLRAWAGSATKDWPDDEQWWLYNYGIDSTSGMKDISKMILSFYTHDDYFENWWTYPDRYAAKMLNSGVKMMVMPDFSQWSIEPRVVSMWAMYKNFWTARYMQEAGIKVIPNVSWRYEDDWYFDNIVRPAYPRECPVIALQWQTFSAKDDPEEYNRFVAFVKHVGESFQPRLTLFYVGKRALQFIKARDFTWPGEYRTIMFRTEALAEQAKGREKKTTL